MNIINLECIKLCNISVPRDYLQASTILTMPNSLLVFPSMFAFLSSCLRVVGLWEGLDHFDQWTTSFVYLSLLLLLQITGNKKFQVLLAVNQWVPSSSSYSIVNCSSVSYEKHTYTCETLRGNYPIRNLSVTTDRCKLHFHTCADTLATLQWLLLTALVDTLSVHSHDSLLKVFILEN